MMRKRLTCLFVAFAVPAFAAFDTTDWDWQRPIEHDADSGGFVRVILTPEVHDQSRASLNDLRVLDELGELVPHVVYWGGPEARDKVEWKKVELINRTFRPEHYVRATLDFVQPVRKNRIKVRMSGKNYRRRVLLEGSEDCLDWETVVEDAWLFDISLPGKDFSVDTVDFPVNNFRYMRLTAYHMPDDPMRIEIEEVQAAFRRVLAREDLIAAPVTFRVLDEKEKKEEKLPENVTVYELDLGLRNLPVALVSVDIADSYFYRGYELRGRNAATERIKRKTETGWDEVERKVLWKKVGHGVLYKIRHQDKISESCAIKNLDAPYRYLRLRLFDRDNPPLDVEDITVLRREAGVVFDYQPGHAYTLVGGNPKAQHPDFDLVQAVEGVQEFEASAASLGPMTAIEHEPVLPPWSERHSVVIWVILVLAVVVMLAFSLKNLGKLREE